MSYFIAASNAPRGLELFHQFSNATIYLMGFSFILGVAFTLLLLVLFDWMRANAEKKED